MKLYRIYTEDKNEAGIIHLANSWFSEGYTILKGTGVWKGAQERSLIIEVIGDGKMLHNPVRYLAEDIKRINQQESVYITSHDIQLQTL